MPGSSISCISIFQFSIHKLQVSIRSKISVCQCMIYWIFYRLSFLVFAKYIDLLFGGRDRVEALRTKNISHLKLNPVVLFVPQVRGFVLLNFPSYTSFPLLRKCLHPTWVFWNFCVLFVHVSAGCPDFYAFVMSRYNHFYHGEPSVLRHFKISTVPFVCAPSSNILYLIIFKDIRLWKLNNFKT